MGAQNQLTKLFAVKYKQNRKVLKFFPHSYKFLTFDIVLHINPNQKCYENTLFHTLLT